MQHVFVVDADQRPLAPCRPARARLLLTQGKAAIWQRYLFTIRLNCPLPQAETPQLRVKLDPGSHITGVALINDATGEVVWAAEIAHRGQQVVDRLARRRSVRRSRRQRHTRYRPARFANRLRPVGWLPPSQESRLANVLTWVERLRRLCGLQHAEAASSEGDHPLADHRTRQT